MEHIAEAKGIGKDPNAREVVEVSPWWKWLDTLGTAYDSVSVPDITNTPAWPEARVFVSSTFLDMHGERDILTRIVFPELRVRPLFSRLL